MKDWLSTIIAPNFTHINIQIMNLNGRLSGIHHLCRGEYTQDVSDRNQYLSIYGWIQGFDL